MRNNSLMGLETYIDKHKISFKEEDEQIFEVHSRQDSFTGAIKDNSELRRNFFIMTFIWVATSCSYYIFSFYITKIQANIYLLNFSSAGSEMLSVFLSNYLYKNIGLRKSLFVSFFMVFMGSLLILIFEATAYK